MGDRITEIHRNCRSRLFPVTEINRSPYGGRIFSAVTFGGVTCVAHDRRDMSRKLEEGRP
jgi:hypothetical protein